MKMHPSVRRAALAAVALACLTAGTARPPKADGPSAKHSPFVAVLARNWAVWDADHDNTLSEAEIDRLVLDPAIKGDDAAAAAALKMVVRNKKLAVPPLTRDYFDQYDARASAPKGSDEDAATATVDNEKMNAGKAPKWDLLFAAGKHRIKVADAAYGRWPEADVLTHMRQGPLGDCFLVAVVGAAVNRDPALVRAMLTPGGAGVAEVKFAPAKAALPVALTDAERAMSSSTGGEGDWLALIEQAYGRYRHQLKAAAGSSEPVEGTDVICHGGTAGPVITALTGHACHYVQLPNDAAKRKAAADRLLPKVRTLLTEGFRDRRVIAAGVRGEPKTTLPDAKPAARIDEPPDPNTVVASASLPSPPNITHGHEYGIIGYNPQTDMVTVWNPHGQTFHPKGPPGLTNGYETQHGMFRLPLTEMYQFFSDFSCETGQAPVQSGSYRAKPK